MTDQEIRIAVAEALGWKEIEWVDLTNPREAFEQKLFCKDNEDRHCGWLPYFVNDLNACHEMEKTLTDKEFDEYRTVLRGIVSTSWRANISATAYQRCKAFLKVKGLWK